MNFGDWVRHKKTGKTGIILQEEGLYTPVDQVWVAWTDILLDTIHAQGSVNIADLEKI